MKVIKNIFYSLICISALSLPSCKKIDDYKSKYAAGGPIIYPGKLDSVGVFSGKNRVLVKGLFTSDPLVVKYRVFWNSKRDSIETLVTRTPGVDTAKVIIPNLPEGVMSFEIRTYDKAGHTSIPVNVAGNVYGTLYQNSLLNRGVAKAEIQTNGSALINWADVNVDDGSVSMQLKYNDAQNRAHDTVVTSIPKGLTTSLPNFKVGEGFSYRTIFKPTPTAIDIFYTDYQTSSVAADITSVYLKNAGNTFKNSSNGGRWGILSDWTTTANVKNHGIYGGWCADQGGCVSMEMGWDGTAKIVNGKIFQTITLPAGNYSFEIVMGKNEALDPVYIIAAEGNTLPDVANISTSLGYTNFANNIFQFKVTGTKTVSIGFLASMTTGNQYWVVKAVKLKSI